MLPAFHDGRYEAGIQEGVTGVLAALRGAYELVERPSPRQSQNPFVAALMIGVAAVAGIWRRFASGGLGNSGNSDWGHSGGGSFSGGGASGHW